MLKIINEDANNSLILDIKDDMTVASQVALNLEGEWNAIRGYNLLIEFLESKHDQESIDKVKEIVSDEKNHTEILRGIILKYDGEIPTAED